MQKPIHAPHGPMLSRLHHQIRRELDGTPFLYWQNLSKMESIEVKKSENSVISIENLNC
jgi:hypothetical protein